MATQLATINSLVNDRRRDTGSTSIDMTGDGFRAVTSTLNLWNQIHDWPWQESFQIINYNEGNTYYTVNSNHKAPIDLRPYRGDARKTEFTRVSPNAFDSSIITNRFAIATVNNTEFIRIKYSGDYLTLNSATAYDGDGTWVGASAISSVATDSYEYFDLGASIQFSYSGTSGTITVSDMDTKDITRFKNRSTIYWNSKLESVTNYTSMTIKIGSDASNYYTGTVTTDYLSQTPTAGQWTKFKLGWSSLSTVGTPVDTAIDYIQLTIAYSSNPSTTIRIENFFIAENVPVYYEYYTNEMVQAASDSAKTQVFSNSSNTTDTTLWSGKWDFINESFVNSVMEIIYWMTGETDDRNVAIEHINSYVENLKRRMPSRRRYPEMQFVTDLNN